MSTPIESVLLEALANMLSEKVKLGLSFHDKTKDKNLLDQASSEQFFREDLEDQFRLDTMDLTHHDGINAAFHKVHSYKYVTDPTFSESLVREFRGQAIPGSEQDVALKALDKLIKEAKGGTNKSGREQDKGWNPSLDEVLEMATPVQYEN